ncbi:MAG: chemotaxis protein CheW [Candidatus Contendobacter sp.]|nr:chemotaxis protein CheW [Candidatus Contendobacter sp.]
MLENPPKDSTAWILTLDGALRAAVGGRELVYLIEAPTLLDVPLSPPYCRQVLVWNENLLPVMDLAAYLRPGKPARRTQALAGVFAYQAKSGAPLAYGALLLAGIPEWAHIADDHASALPKQPAGWRALAISCFKRGDDLIPILDLPHLFTGGLLATV